MGHTSFGGEPELSPWACRIDTAEPELALTALAEFTGEGQFRRHGM